MGDYYITHSMQVQDDVLCSVQCTPLHCNNFEFTIHLIIVGLLSTALFQYLKCQDKTDFQKLQKHFHILQFMKSLRGAHFTFSLPGGGAHP